MHEFQYCEGLIDCFCSFIQNPLNALWLGYDGITFQKSFRSHQLDSEEKRIQVIITLRERFSSQLLTYPG